MNDLDYEAIKRAFEEGYRLGSDWVLFIPFADFLTEAQNPGAFRMYWMHEFCTAYRVATGEIVAVGIEESAHGDSRRMDLADFRRLVATGALRVVVAP